MLNKLKIIEGDSSLVYYESGNIITRNKYVTELDDMEDVEFWEDRLESQGIDYCLTYYHRTGYTIFVDYTKLVDNQNNLC